MIGAVRNNRGNTQSSVAPLKQLKHVAFGIGDTARVWARRCVCGVKGLFSGRRQVVTPLPFLAIAVVAGVSLTITNLYTPSYAVYVNGEVLGVVSDQAVVEHVVAMVEQQGEEILGYSYRIEDEIRLEPGLNLKSSVSGEMEIENYFFAQLDEVGDALRKYQVTVEGTVVGVIADKEQLNSVLDSIKNQYATEDTISSSFAEHVEIQAIYRDEDVLSPQEIYRSLNTNREEEVTHVVARRETFNSIAHAYDISASELQALNPDANPNRLTVGQELVVKEAVPLLTVKTVAQVTYSEPIECPVETVKDDNMYEGDTRIVNQGVEGEQRINANLIYVNGVEVDREVLTITTTREPTPTTQAEGTKERPKTASVGDFIWPYSGRISSYFGGRYIFGSYSYHSGIDISGNYGDTVVAADGGTVTFTGYKGSYGNLVVITHDNGVQSYYAHNSSILVSTGTRVFQGQEIALVGSTGRSTGNHVHFEVRVDGVAVDPLSCLP